MIRPDFREVKNSELYHFGVSKRNGAPGPGSGRYPLGSGDRPFQSDSYNYKESSRYKQLTYDQRKLIDNQLKQLNKIYNDKKIRRISYNMIEKGKSKDQAILLETGRGFVKGVAVMTITTTALIKGLSLYDKYVTRIKANNVVVDAYALKEGLKAYNKFMPTLGIDAIKIGEKALERMI